MFTYVFCSSARDEIPPNVADDSSQFLSIRKRGETNAALRFDMLFSLPFHSHQIMISNFQNMLIDFNMYDDDDRRECTSRASGVDEYFETIEVENDARIESD